MAASFRVLLVVEDKRGAPFYKGIVRRLREGGHLPACVAIEGVRKCEKCNSKLGRIVRAALAPLRARRASDRVVIVVDAEGRPLEQAREEASRHVPAEHRERTRVVVLPYCAEEWVCVSLGLPFGSERTPVEALKDHLRRQRGAKADYQKYMLGSFVDKLDMDRLMKHPSFREFVEALRP